MAQLTPDQVAQGWDALAHSYEQHMMHYTSVCAENALRLAEIKPGERVLDVAAGPGTFALLTARLGAQTIAIDYSPTMIESLRRRIAAEKLENLSAEVMDGQALNLPDDSFDAAVSVFGLIFFPDRTKGFSEMRRVLRPDGRVIVTGWGAPQRVASQVVMGQAVRKVFPDLPAPTGPQPISSLSDPKAFEAEMLAAGFREVQVHTILFTLTFPSPNEVWESLTGASPAVAALLERASQAKRDEVRQVLFDILKGQFGDGPVQLSCEANIGIGVK